MQEKQIIDKNTLVLHSVLVSLISTFNYSDTITSKLQDFIDYLDSILYSYNFNTDIKDETFIRITTFE